MSSFEQRLLDEIDYREGQIAPQHHEPDHEAFRAGDVTDPRPPQFEQKLKNFQLMEGSDATFVCKVTGQPLPFVSAHVLLVVAVFYASTSTIDRLPVHERTTCTCIDISLFVYTCRSLGTITVA